jgi:hypothetical protein
MAHAVAKIVTIAHFVARAVAAAAVVDTNANLKVASEVFVSISTRTLL